MLTKLVLKLPTAVNDEELGARKSVFNFKSNFQKAVAWTVALVANKLAYDPGERNAYGGSTTFWLLGVHGA